MIDITANLGAFQLKKVIRPVCQAVKHGLSTVTVLLVSFVVLSGIATEAGMAASNAAKQSAATSNNLLTAPLAGSVFTDPQIVALRKFVAGVQNSEPANSTIENNTLVQTAGIEVSKGRLVIGPGEHTIEFDVPLSTGPEPVVGNSIKSLIDRSPMFSPIKGLSEDYWKTKKCSNCHKWEKKSLCDQGKVYATNEPAHILRKQHPYGGAFKLALRNWSKTGCQ